MDEHRHKGPAILLLYVNELIGREVINTMPEKTLRAFADQREVTRALDADPSAAQARLADADRVAIDLDAVTSDSNVRASNRSARPITSSSTASRPSSPRSRQQAAHRRGKGSRPSLTDAYTGQR